MKIETSEQTDKNIKTIGIVLSIILVPFFLVVFFDGLFPEGSFQDAVVVSVMLWVMFLYAFKLVKEENYTGLRTIFITMLILWFLSSIL